MTQQTITEQFHNAFITSTEVRNILMVSRTALHYRRKSGKLPESVVLDNSVTIWRREELKPHLEQWSTELYGRVLEGI